MESPESRIVPTEDMNTVQLKISGERFPEWVPRDLLDLSDVTREGEGDS